MTFGMSVPKKAEVETDHALSENSTNPRAFPKSKPLSIFPKPLKLPQKESTIKQVSPLHILLIQLDMHDLTP